MLCCRLPSSPTAGHTCARGLPLELPPARPMRQEWWRDRGQEMYRKAGATHTGGEGVKNMQKDGSAEEAKPLFQKSPQTCCRVFMSVSLNNYNAASVARVWTERRHVHASLMYGFRVAESLVTHEPEAERIIYIPSCDWAIFSWHWQWHSTDTVFPCIIFLIRACVAHCSYITQNAKAAVFIFKWVFRTFKENGNKMVHSVWWGKQNEVDLMLSGPVMLKVSHFSQMTRSQVFGLKRQRVQCKE